MSLAIFDLDNTLLGGDSDHAWGQFLIDKNIVDAARYQQANDLFFQQYQQGTMDINEFLEFALQPLAAHEKQQLDQWHQQFMRDYIAPLRLAKADALLQQHRQQGDYLLIITATNLFVTEPIAASLGVDHIIATLPEFKDGAYTGKVEGIPCFQGGKVQRLNEWLAGSGQSMQGSCFYSDSINDLPLLEQVEKAIAVDPDKNLATQARQRGWPIISLRD